MNNQQTHTHRLVLFSHDSMGLGHLRRNLALAHHISRSFSGTEQLRGVLVTGLEEAKNFTLPAGFDWLVLPGVRKGEQGYQPRDSRYSWQELLSYRSQQVNQLFETFLPQLVIIDRHIFGVEQELKAPLTRLRELAPEAHVVLGMREVLDSPDRAAREWTKLAKKAELESFIDSFWVYGDRTVHDPLASGEIPAELARKLAPKVHYTGYLAKGRQEVDSSAPKLPGQKLIITTAGGGADGQDLLSAAVRAEVPAGYEHLIVAGPQLPQKHFEALLEAAPENTRLVRSYPGLSRLIAGASAVLSMGGYNTVCEILATNTPALIVPREAPRQEQLIRARALGRRGAVDYLRPAELTPEKLSKWLAQALGKTTPRTQLDLDGLSRASELAAQIFQRAETKG